MFLYEITHRYLKNDYQFFDTLKTKDRKIRGNCNLLIKVKFYKLEWSSPLSCEFMIMKPLRHFPRSDNGCNSTSVRAKVWYYWC